jgi:hypothetical protein
MVEVAYWDEFGWLILIFWYGSLIQKHVGYTHKRGYPKTFPNCSFYMDNEWTL